ncbi:hypothetical protein GIB67_003137 [Kingdonia uniflora]|uniref:Uncharacterized protein n=1 Tax=Kingdonia uniflora TaxID=39325 RepID=A0A7J7N5V6_9MAGN|nr:hypothetical protein GIB67_003137 [Kingdonia uniflora]
MDVVLDKLKEFTYTLLYNPQSYCCCHNPIEILKRLQREAFSDIMKLGDRLDKHDRLLSSFYKSTPFNHSTTHLSGEVDVGGALLFVDNVGGCTALNEAGIRTGIHSRFTFQTNITSNDAFAAEFVSAQSDKANSDDVLGSPLSLTEVMYSTNFNNCDSAVVIPWGARWKDVAVASNPLPQVSLPLPFIYCLNPDFVCEKYLFQVFQWLSARRTLIFGTNPYGLHFHRASDIWAISVGLPSS